MKTNRVLWTVLTVLIVTSLMISACGSSATPEPAPAATTAPVATEAPAAPAATEAPAAQPAQPAEAMMGPDGRASYAGLDMDLTGHTIRMANIGG
ncbi:MAG: hypothetical protein KDH90_02285, partial [Anaerolineae bacterium]|nr:hypothetical protein [Anaerolineae bacterium]